ncbi:hypothetical protein [Acinetobacter sp. YH12245]|uniref:hypothetical protein n=1 Tax=Acinetobacter sp. YH12245 TaxID=2601171 RepID=UPI0015D15C5B|nr:hypothetical protein [Acinetobacter sp. YH12245]
MNNQIPALKQKINAAVKALMKDAFDANSDDFHVFFEFSGHVSLFALHYYIGGYSENKDLVYLCRCSTQPLPSQLRDVEAWKESLSELIEARKKLKQLKEEQSKKLWSDHV